MSFHRHSKRTAAPAAGNSARQPDQVIPPDLVRAYEAMEVARHHRGWLVMWSTWHRTFTAFACFAPEALVIDAPTADALAAQLRLLELSYIQRPVALAKR